MEAVEITPAIDRNPAKLRSATTNGTRTFVKGGDGRGAWVRRWQDLRDMHVADLGGRDVVSAARFSLCQRAATIEVELEREEAWMSQGTARS